MPEQVLSIDLLVYRVARGQYKKCLSPGMQTEFRGEGGKNQIHQLEKENAVELGWDQCCK